jgi:hypothetical protein
MKPITRIIITVFFKIQLAIKYTYWHGMKIAKGIKTLGPLYSNYVATSSNIIQFGFFNYNGNIYIMYQVKAETNTADYRSTFILNNIGQIDKVFPKEKYAVI